MAFHMRKKEFDGADARRNGIGRRPAAVLSIGGASALLGAAAARAQEPAAPPPALPDPLTPETIRELVATLSDAEVRGLLLERLDAVAEAQAVEAAATGPGIGDMASAVGAHMVSVLSDLGATFAGLGTMIAGLSGGSAGGFALFLGVLAAAIALGFAAKVAVRRAVGADGPRLPSAFGRFGEAMRRFGGALLGLLAYAIVAGVTIRLGRAILPAPEVQGPAAWSIAFVVGVTLPLVHALLVLALAPGRPDLRALSADDATATRITRSVMGLAILMAALSQISQLQMLAGVDPFASGYAFWAYLLFTAFAIAFLIKERASLSAMMAAPGEATTPGSWPHLWPRLAVVLVTAQWVLVEVITALGLTHLLHGQSRLSMALILMLPGLDSLIRAGAERLTPTATGEGEAAEAAAEATGRAYLRMGRVFVYVALVMLIGKLWGLTLFGLASSGMGAGLAAGLLKFLSICAIGYFIYELVNVQINLRLSREMTGAAPSPEEQAEIGGEGGGGATASRLATVLPLIRWVALGSIIGFTFLLALSQAGVDIAPLLAGAGVFGLAIGFGAQTLVKDVVSGLFFLVDDAFRQGEYIDVGGTVGTVERISIRSVQLRHHRGAVHTIPYGEIAKVTNFSRDWVIMKLKFTVPFGTDPNKVKKIFKQIGKDLEQIPEFKGDLMQPFKSQGVLEFDDVGMVLRGKFMARPGKQFTIRKEILTRVNAAFAEAGIEFARREVRVRVSDEDGEDAADDPRVRQAIGAAAGQAAAQAAQPPQG